MSTIFNEIEESAENILSLVHEIEDLEDEKDRMENALSFIDDYCNEAEQYIEELEDLKLPKVHQDKIDELADYLRNIINDIRSEI